MFLEEISVSRDGKITPTKTKKTSASNPPKKKYRKKTKGRNKYSEEDAEVYRIGLYYEQRLMECRGFSKRLFKVGPTKDHKSWAHFKTVLYQARDLKMKPEDFVEAQFWFFNKRYRKYPQPFDLSPNRIVRPSPYETAKKWLEIYQQCPSYYEPPKNISCVKTPTKQEIDQYYARVLKDTMRQFNLSEGDVFLIFGADLFPVAFLERQPAYHALKSSNFI